jgi:hypothetical protein
MTLSQAIHDFLFGHHENVVPNGERQKWREAIHENKNATQVASAAAIKATRVSREAERVAKSAVTLLEQANHKKKEADGG